MLSAGGRLQGLVTRWGHGDCGKVNGDTREEGRSLGADVPGPLGPGCGLLAGLPVSEVGERDRGCRPGRTNTPGLAGGTTPAPLPD